MAERPWKWKDRSHYMVGVSVGHDPKSGRAAIGWAALNLGGPSSHGEAKFDEALTPERAAMEATLRFREHVASLPRVKWPTVELYRYTKASWPRSIAAAEGGTHSDHKKRIRETAKALREEGANVVFRTV